MPSRSLTPVSGNGEAPASVEAGAFRALMGVAQEGPMNLTARFSPHTPPGRRRFMVTGILVLLGLLAGLAALTPWPGALTPRPAAMAPTIGLIEAGPAAGPAASDRALAFWQARVERDPRDYISLTYLGLAYVNTGREWGDAESYGRAEAALQRALGLKPDYEPALAYLATVQFAQHDFAGALALAERVYAFDPAALQALATIGDARLELGDYAGAAESYAALQQASDGAPVLSRLARLAWLNGDVAGATRLVEQAVAAAHEAGLSGDQLAWYRAQQGELAWHQGDLATAATAYEAALVARPGYYLGLAGRARVAAARGDWPTALASYEQVVAVTPQPVYLAALGDLYLLAGDPVAAERQFATIEAIARLEAARGISYNRQLAHFYADHKRHLDRAVAMAEEELAQRQDIYAHDAYAWALYRAGRLAEAAPAMEQALRLGTPDATLYYHAGLIAAARGDAPAARTALARALALNPAFDPRGAGEARAWLERLAPDHPAP